MTLGRRLLLLGAACGALYGAGLFYEMDLAPAGCCGLSWPVPDPIAAERRLSSADPRGLGAAAQRETALDALRASPGEAIGWTRLAYADRLAHGRLTQAGAQAIETSYLVLPYAGPQSYWRLAFDFDNWSALTPQGRQDAMAEMRIALRDDNIYLSATRHPPVRNLAKTVADPSGRLAAALLAAD